VKLQDAQQTVGHFLSPLTVDQFLDEVLLGGFAKIGGNRQAGRTDLLGADPQSALLEAVHLAPKLTFHSANASGPPPSLAGVRDRADFQERIAEFHARHYSVRFPELRPLSSALEHLGRALEALLHQPVTASAFWSRGGLRAPVHCDDHDLLVVQLRGAKRWLIARKASGLENTWKGIPGEPPELGDHESLDLLPGDLLYLPRGTFHSVDSDVESLHLSIGFTPLTVREAVIAALDHLSDADRTLRMTAGNRLAFQLRGAGIERFGPLVMESLARLVGACRTPGFLNEALQRRSARAIGWLQATPAAACVTEISLDTVLVHRDTAFCHLTANPDKIDFAYPGGHLYIHRGAEESVLYIANTTRFAVRDIPGGLRDDARLSLARRFVEVGFLEPASDAPAPSA